ncbi:MAG: hypothetical protein QNL62_14020 [Gammaproteobacteria bacterium]|nr:hypothetical protein [Gammaproteobacteria bacterium]
MLTNTNLTYIFTVIAILSFDSYAAETMCPKGLNPNPNVIWCDSFEDEDLGSGNTVDENYYIFDKGSDPENMVRVNNQSIHGVYALKHHWNAGAGSGGTGSFIRTFGRNPANSQSHSSQDFNDIYWRFYIKLQAGFSGQPNKLTRATIFTDKNWAQAMIAHMWALNNGPLELDPATGIDLNTNLLASTGWNDFANLTFLGKVKGNTLLVPDTWYCVEAHVKLNTPDQTNGAFEYWRDDKLQASRSDLNWVGTWNDYGINTIMISNYWNETSPKEQERYIDALVISTERIGCLVAPPKPPSNITVQ